MTLQKVKVVVWSDLACPYCYIGKRRLDQALAEAPEVAAEMEWHAFVLDWNTPEGGVPIDDALRKKFGGQAPALMERVVRMGRGDGAPFANWKWRANTVKGHMLVVLARRHGKSHEANELLFQRSYETGDNISDADVLLDVGRQLGLPEDELQAAFGGGEVDGELLREVQKDDAVAKARMHVTGVPFFLISSGESRKFALSGAQPPEAFQEAIRLALQEAPASSSSSIDTPEHATDSSSARAAACTLDGGCS